MLEDNPNVSDVRQRNTSKWTDSLSSVETVADSILIGGSRDFGSDGELEEQIAAKLKSDYEQFNEMMGRGVARWTMVKT